MTLSSSIPCRAISATLRLGFYCINPHDKIGWILKQPNWLYRSPGLLVSGDSPYLSWATFIIPPKYQLQLWSESKCNILKIGFHPTFLLIIGLLFNSVLTLPCVYQILEYFFINKYRRVTHKRGTAKGLRPVAEWMVPKTSSASSELTILFLEKDRKRMQSLSFCD